MNGRWRRLVPSALVLLLALGACDAPMPTEQPAPSEQTELLGGLLPLGQPAGYTLVREPLVQSLLGSLTTSGLIGVGGGSITLLGHTVTVPAGAVAQPTLFTILVLPSGYVEVGLDATIHTVLGTVIDVGGDGFLKPVPVTLSYARATNVSDPSRLRVLRINSLTGYRNFEVMPSQVDVVKRTVSTELDHFSRYALAYP